MFRRGIVKRQGKGTFVREGQIAPTVHEDRRTVLNGFSVSCRLNGLEPGAHLLHREVIDAPLETHRFFGKDTQVIAIDRLCTADGVPIMLDHCLFIRKSHEFLETADLEDACAVRAHPRRDRPAPARDSAEMLSIQLADEQVARALSRSVGEPLFSLEGSYRDQDGKPLYVGKQLIIGSRYTFSM